MLCKKIYFAFATTDTLVVKKIGLQTNVPNDYSTILNVSESDERLK